MLFLRSVRKEEGISDHKTEKSSRERQRRLHRTVHVELRNTSTIERYWLDVGLMKCHEAGVDRDGHRGEVKVIEEHRQMVVKALGGCEIQLQCPAKRNVRQSPPIDHTYVGQRLRRDRDRSPAISGCICGRVSNRCPQYVWEMRTHSAATCTLEITLCHGDPIVRDSPVQVFYCVFPVAITLGNSTRKPFKDVRHVQKEARYNCERRELASPAQSAHLVH